MFVLGITGGIGCGKTTVAEYFRKAGVTVFDADQLSRQASKAGGVAINKIIEVFGNDYLDSEGSLDRKKMSDLVFSDRRALDQLSKIIHEEVMQEIINKVQLEVKKKTKICVLDVPIPVKHGFLDLADHVLLVWSNNELRTERLRDRGLLAEDIDRRIAMQMTEEEYSKLANTIIRNDSSVDDLYYSLEKFCDKELVSRGIRISTAKH